MPTYTIAIHVPIYTDGAQTFVIPEWKRALELLRDSFRGAFDRFILVAPSRPKADADVLLEQIGGDDGFDPRPSIPLDISKRAYWMGGGRRSWMRDAARALDETDFAHTVIDNLYRPISLDAQRLARARGLPHAFFLDTDIVMQNRQLAASGLIRNGPDRALYNLAYERVLHGIVGAADLTFLKGQALFDRYGAAAHNPKLFHDTSYLSSEIVDAGIVERRLAARDDKPVRLVYCGRLVPRKGCDHSIRIVAAARGAGADVTLDLIGDGPERAALETLAAKLGQSDAIRFLGEKPYGQALLSELAGYDALFFTPLAEDTPRMIFDGYAAGLPLVAYDIPYVQERAAEEGATVLMPVADLAAAGGILADLSRDRGRLAALARTALQAAHNNASDVWYSRRAGWTIEACERAGGLRS